MIYGREQFGGLGDDAEVGPAVLPLFTPDSIVYGDRRSDVVQSTTVSGASPFATSSITNETSLTGAGLWIPASTDPPGGLFRAIAGGTRPLQCSGISMDLSYWNSLRFPVPELFITDTPTGNDNKISLRVRLELFLNRGTLEQTNPNPSKLFQTLVTTPRYAGWTENFLEFDGQISITRVSWENLYAAGCPFDPVRTINTITASDSLWHTGIEQLGNSNLTEVQRALVVEVIENGNTDSPILSSYVPQPEDTAVYSGGFRPRGAVKTAEDDTVLYGNELRDIDLRLFVSPYTNRGYASVCWDVNTSSGYMREGVVLTFPHNLAALPAVSESWSPAFAEGETEVRDRYFAGYEQQHYSQLPTELNYSRASAGITGNNLPFYATLKTTPRVLECDRPPVLPSSTNMQDAEQAMFLSYLGEPGRVLYLDGAPQQQPLADQLALEPFGNQWATNVAPASQNAKPTNYQLDFTNICYFTGPHRHSSLPSNNDWTGLTVTLGLPPEADWPCFLDGNTIKGRSSDSALSYLPSGPLNQDDFVLLNIFKGDHALGTNREDGKHLGTNRYTTGNTRPNEEFTLDNRGEGFPVTGGAFHVPLIDNFTPLDNFNYHFGTETLQGWNGIGGVENHVLVSSPSQGISSYISELPRLSESLPDRTEYDRETILLNIDALGNAKSPKRSLVLSAQLSSDYAFDEFGSTRETDIKIFRYFRVGSAFPYPGIHPVFGLLAGGGTRSKMIVKDRCVYADLKFIEPDQFAEVVGKPQIYVRLKFSANVQIDNEYAETHVREAINTGNSYQAGDVVRKLIYDGLTSSTTAIAQFEIKLMLSESESSSLIDGNSLTVYVSPRKFSGQTREFARNTGSLENVFIPITLSPQLA